MPCWVLCWALSFKDPIATMTTPSARWTLPARLRRNRNALLALKEVSTRVREAMLGSVSEELILALAEAAKNIILGNVPLTASQSRELRMRANQLRELAKKRTSKKRRLELLSQNGAGLLSSLLAPLASLLGGVFGGGRR